MANTPSNQSICEACHQPILARYYFCPNCGHNIKARPAAVSVWLQIGLYALAIFLPPLGLWPGIKYLLKKGNQAKWVGGITVVLTVISTVVTIWATIVLYEHYLSQYQGLLY